MSRLAHWGEWPHTLIGCKRVSVGEKPKQHRTCCVCMYVCMYVCVYVCMCVYIYIYIYTYTHIYNSYNRTTHTDTTCSVLFRFFSDRDSLTTYEGMGSLSSVSQSTHTYTSVLCLCYCYSICAFRVLLLLLLLPSSLLFKHVGLVIAMLFLVCVYPWFCLTHTATYMHADSTHAHTHTHSPPTTHTHTHRRSQLIEVRANEPTPIHGLSMNYRKK